MGVEKHFSIKKTLVFITPFTIYTVAKVPDQKMVDGVLYMYNKVSEFSCSRCGLIGG